MRILIVGAGYVGLANAIALATTHEVTVLDLNPDRVASINSGRMPFQDTLGDQLIHRLVGKASQDADFSAYDLVMVATPTDYDADTGEFDCSSVLSVVARCLPNQDVVIRSTVPIGFCSGCDTQANLMFAPEFLQEGRAVNDTLYPSRFILGCSGTDHDQRIAEALVSGCVSAPNPILMGTTEAESVKLFANGYLAMRVAFFNELDSFCMARDLSAKSVIGGVCADPRIGAFYNNPSFGFGGYCFPKDSKQLMRDCRREFDSHLTRAVVKSNDTRAILIAKEVRRRLSSVGDRSTLGVYSMRMKAGSDNTRSNAVSQVLQHMPNSVRVVHRSEFACISEFVDACDLILANRVEPELVGCDKVFSRDLYGIN